MSGKEPASGGGGTAAKKAKRAKEGLQNGNAAPASGTQKTHGKPVKGAPGRSQPQPRGRDSAQKPTSTAKRATPKPRPQLVEEPAADDAPAADVPAKKRRKRGPAFWDSLPGWQEIEVGPDFLLGAEEGGFAGLEILEDPSVLDQYMMTGGCGDANGDAGKGSEGEGHGNKGGGEPVDANGKVGGKASAAYDIKQKKHKKQKEAKGEAAASGEQDDADTDADADADAADNGAVDAVDTAAAEEERKRKQRERMKAKKARRKERRLQRLAGGAAEGDGSEEPGAEDAGCGQEAKERPKTAAPATQRRKQAGHARGEEPEEEESSENEGEEEEEEVDFEDVFRGSDDDGEMDEDEEAVEEDQGESKEFDLEAGEEEEDEEEEDGDQGETASEDPQPQPPEPEAVDLSAWAEFELHPGVLQGLRQLGFSAPTPIQRECLHPAIRARADIIGAAQTGSGKTLAFGLPILQLLAAERTARARARGGEGSGGEEGVEEERQKRKRKQTGRAGDKAAASPKPEPGPLRALILTPTRELAMQVCSHLQAIGRPCGVRVTAIVGGLSDVKQARLLAARPAVLVATPGRLWDLMCRPPSTDRNGPAAAAHLSDLSRLSFVVLDEADRMVAQGHFKELSSILELLPHPVNAKDVTEDPEFAELRAQKERERREREQKKRGQGQGQGRKKGRRESEHGEEKEEAEAEGPSEDREDELLRESEEAAKEEAPDGEDPGEEAADEGEPEEQQQGQEEGDENPSAAADLNATTKEGKKKHLLQTFVFSATLTLPLFLKKRLRRGGGGAGGGAATLESLMDRVPFRTSPAPRVADLTSERRLADRVAEAAVTCLEEERDEVLYYLLARHPGRTLVFANAVSAVRRVGALLRELGLPAYPLHAQQQQRQRLKALDRFRAQPQAILVATDVAARGLDIPGVAAVVHYQLPASADTYIHRCGRTARGLSGDGVSIALVTPREAPRFAGLARVLGRDPPPAFPIDQSLMPQARARVRLAIRLDDIERKERKQRAEEAWRRSNAKALGLDVSDDEARGATDSDEDGGGGRRLRNGRQIKPSAQAAALRQQLAALLAEPLAPKMSRRYFTGGLAAAVATRVKERPTGPAAAGAPAAKGAAADGKSRAAAAAVPAAAAAAVPQAVALASRLHESQQAATAAAADAAARKKQKAKRKASAAAGATAGAVAGSGARKAGGTKAGGRGGRPGFDPRLAVSRNQLKKQHHRGMVVIPQAFGRDAAAPNALDALRARMAALGGGGGGAGAAVVAAAGGSGGKAAGRAGAGAGAGRGAGGRGEGAGKACRGKGGMKGGKGGVKGRKGGKGRR